MIGVVLEKNVKDQKLDATFSDIKTENKAAFFESLKVFQNNNPNFLSSIINREMCIRDSTYTYGNVKNENVKPSKNSEKNYYAGYTMNSANKFKNGTGLLCK